jgi:DNA (cytosine-5)-methyltransferase 1
LVSLDGESWLEHLARLQGEHTSVRSDLQYRVVPTLVNAANFGVPQHRWRVFLVGFRSDVDAEWSFPVATHSTEALQYDQFVSGDYWERHRVPLAARLKAPERLIRRLDTYSETDRKSLGRPWRTVRDAISDLPKPRLDGGGRYLNHRLQPGARSYAGHTGSYIDAPSKALKAGVHGVPGGENMLRSPDGSVRYFTVRESARLQTFPDGYKLHGGWSEAMRQLGNAVPVLLAEKVAGSVAEHLAVADVRAELAQRARRTRPRKSIAT